MMPTLYFLVLMGSLLGGERKHAPMLKRRKPNRVSFYARMVSFMARTEQAAKGDRGPGVMLWVCLGRAVIAMTAVRVRTCVERGKVADLSDVRPSTDVMAITSLPLAPANHPVSGSPLSVIFPATCHPGLPTAT